MPTPAPALELFQCCFFLDFSDFCFSLDFLLSIQPMHMVHDGSALLEYANGINFVFLA
jgi:hypothetical protein